MTRGQVIAYVDGACDPNPGPGGWGVVLLYRDAERVINGGTAEKTTNNRMELVAAIRCLEALNRPARIKIHSDSQYVVLGMTTRLAQWKADGRFHDPETRNVDLWQALLDLVENRGHEVEWQWVKAHAGNEGNERADRLANEGLRVARASKRKKDEDW